MQAVQDLLDLFGRWTKIEVKEEKSIVSAMIVDNLVKALLILFDNQLTSQE
jgi:hypothetical protein